MNITAIDEVPEILLSLKQRGSYKVLSYSGNTLTVWDDMFKSVEATLEIEGIVGIAQ